MNTVKPLQQAALQGTSPPPHPMPFLSTAFSTLTSGPTTSDPVVCWSYWDSQRNFWKTAFGWYVSAQNFFYFFFNPLRITKASAPIQVTGR